MDMVSRNKKGLHHMVQPSDKEDQISLLGNQALRHLMHSSVAPHDAIQAI
jgi:hypothetical protein